MKKIVLLIICLKSVFVFGQQTGTFYYSILGERCDKKIAKTISVISSSDMKVYKEVVSIKYNDGWNKGNSYNLYRFENDSSINIELFVNDKLSRTTKRIYKKLNDSIYSIIDYNNDLTLNSKGFASSLLPLIYQGKLESFYRNGNKYMEAIYKNNRMISNLTWKQNGESDISNVFFEKEVEVEPKFASGSILEYIENELRYPPEALKNNIACRVVLQVIIMEDGSVDGLKVLKGVNPQLDAEAIRVMKLTSKKWTPGKIKNVPVRVVFSIPITFRP
jgi:TonB family protein